MRLLACMQKGLTFLQLQFTAMIIDAMNITEMKCFIFYLVDSRYAFSVSMATGVKEYPWLRLAYLIINFDCMNNMVVQLSYIQCYSIA